MSYEALTIAEIASGKPVTNALMTKIKDDLAYLYGTLGTLSAYQVLNGSFEIDSNDDGVPDSWSRSLYTGGSGGLYTTSPAHGAQAAYFTHPGGSGNGGGYLDSDYIECSELYNHFVQWTHWVTSAGVKVMIQLRYFDKDQSELGGSPVTIWSSTSNPTSAYVRRLGFVPISGAKYFKVRLIGGYDDTDVAATIYFDNVITGVIPMQGFYYGAYPNHLIGAADTTSTSYVKLLECVIPGWGSLRGRWLQASGGGSLNTFVKIYRNGSAVGSEFTNTSATPLECSEDISGWSYGDLFQLYGKAETAGTCYITEAQIRLNRYFGFWNNDV